MADDTREKKSVWDKTIHASFRKVMAYDLLCIAMGIIIGMGIGVFIIKGAP